MVEVHTITYHKGCSQDHKWYKSILQPVIRVVVNHARGLKSTLQPVIRALFHPLTQDKVCSQCNEGF